MMTKAYCILDLKTSQYARPFFFATDGEAIRAMSDSISAGDSLLAKHPADFVLYRVGQFDSDTGDFDACSPVPIGPLSEYVTAK